MKYVLLFTCILMINYHYNFSSANINDSANDVLCLENVKQLKVKNEENTVKEDCKSYTVTPVPKEIKQPKQMDCWATVLTMMYEYKQQKDLTILDVMNNIGSPYKDLFTNNSGISAAQKTQLIINTGLRSELPANFTIGGWCELLRRNGPLWVTTDESPEFPKATIHARLLYGMMGDGSPENTLMFFIDPATGTKISEPFGEFVIKYESELRKIYKILNGRDLPSNYKIRIQVIHW